MAIYKEIFVPQAVVDILAQIGDCSWHNEGLVRDIPKLLAEGQPLLLLMKTKDYLSSLLSATKYLLSVTCEREKS